MASSVSHVSIGVPTFNSSAYIAQTISSILGQSYPHIELIISDDCSADDTREILSGFTDSRLKLFYNGQRRGLVGNWNRCLALATAPYVCVFNHDDLMHPDNLARKVAILDAHPEVAFVFSDVEEIDSGGTVIGGHWTPEALPQEDTVWRGADFFRLNLAWGNLVPAPSVVMRRALVQELGGFDPRLYFSLDLEMWMRLSLHGDVGYVAAPSVQLRRHTGQVTAGFQGNGREVEQVWQALQIVFSDQRAFITDPEVALQSGLGQLRAWTQMLGRQALRSGHLRAAARYLGQNLRFRRLARHGLIGLPEVTRS